MSKDVLTKEDLNDKWLKLISKLEPLCSYEWETMVLDAELGSIMLILAQHRDKKFDVSSLSVEELKISSKRIQSDYLDSAREATRLSYHILKMSREIRRLRHKCGEEVWWMSHQSTENKEREKQAFADKRDVSSAPKEDVDSNTHSPVDSPVDSD